MMLYLTGANSSLSKSDNIPQSDPNKSLGGFVSSTVVPNSSPNVLFDLLSSLAIQNKQTETIAIGLINKFESDVDNVTIKVATELDNMTQFNIGVVKLDSNYYMERIDNRYQQPYQCNFHNVDFTYASVECEILNPGIVGEEFSILPFGVICVIKESGYDGVWMSIEESFFNNNDYEVKRISEKSFSIKSKNPIIVEPLECDYITSDSLQLRFNGLFENSLKNFAKLTEDGEVLSAGSGLGIWIQRRIKPSVYETNEKLIDNYLNKVEKDSLEKVEIVIDYNVV